MPGWQVARMWLGGLVSYLAAEALWALMHIDEIGCYHIPTCSPVTGAYRISDAGAARQGCIFDTFNKKHT